MQGILVTFKTAFYLVYKLNYYIFSKINFLKTKLLLAKYVIVIKIPLKVIKADTAW